MDWNEQGTLPPEEKKKALYGRQKEMLEIFLEHGTITRAQYEKSLRDLTEKMGYGSGNSFSAASEVYHEEN